LIKNLRYFQVGVSVEDICGIQVIHGQILFEFRISFGFRISDFSGAWRFVFSQSASNATHRTGRGNEFGFANVMAGFLEPGDFAKPFP
jgi:hypothetical protein